MNQTIDLIKNHRSIRHFTDQSLSKEQIDALLDSAIAASTSSYLQCTSIIHVTDPKIKQTLAICAGNQPYVETCADFFVFCMDFNRHQSIANDAKLGLLEQTLIGAVDAGIMGENMMLAAESMNLGGVFIGGIRNQPEQVSIELKLPQHVMALFGLCIGYPKNNPAQKPRLPKSISVHHNHYQPIDKKELADYDQTVSDYYNQRTNGKITHSWSEQIGTTLAKEMRPFMKASLNKKGFSTD